MSIGWFDAFRENGAPTWYGENPTPVRLDLGLAVLCWLFLSPTLAFLLILPGIRRFRALSAFSFLFSMAVGATLAVSIHYPGWHCGQLRVFTAFRAHTRHRISATLGVNVGLSHVNITLSSDPAELEIDGLPRPRLPGSSREHRLAPAVDSDIGLLLFGPDNLVYKNGSKNGNNKKKSSAFPSIASSTRRPQQPAALDFADDFWPAEEPELFYNERFDFDDVSGMEVHEVLRKGLPFPILRVVEYLSVDRTGFLWGKQYRLAGYYSMAALWLAFALWLLQMLLLCALPHRFGQASMLCGLSTLFADAVYAWHVPGPADLFMIFPGPDELAHRLEFHLSSCFYATLAAGVASTVVGSLLWLLEVRTSFRLETFFSAYTDRMCRPRSAAGNGKRPSLVLWSSQASGLWRPSANRGSLCSPKGSFTSLGHPEQAVGWKRRRRTLQRMPRPCPADESAMEMRTPSGLSWGQKATTMRGQHNDERRFASGERRPPMETPPDSVHSPASSQDCSHLSQPSTSSASTRPMDESEAPSSPQSPTSHASGGSAEAASSSPSSSASSSFWPASEWTFGHRERDRGGGEAKMPAAKPAKEECQQQEDEASV